MWERGIKVYCNTLVNHLTSIQWTQFGQHSRLQDLKTMVSQKYRIEAELQRDTKDCWLYADTEHGGLGTIQLEQWTLIRTIITQLKLLKTPPAPIAATQATLFAQGAKWEPGRSKGNQPIYTLAITQDPEKPKWPELEILRYAACIYGISFVITRDKNLPDQISKIGISPNKALLEPIWENQAILEYLKQKNMQYIIRR